MASQGVGVATGIQNKFSWKAVGMAALGGGIGGATAGWNPLGGNIGAFANDVARGVINNAAMQGLGVATGLQNKFNWAGVAVAGVVAGIGGAVGRGIGGSVGSSYFNKLGEEMVRATPSFTNSLLSGMAGGIAGAAARSLADGTSFGDNLIATLPDVLGSTIGASLAGAINGPKDYLKYPRGGGGSSTSGAIRGPKGLMVPSPAGRYAGLAPSINYGLSRNYSGGWLQSAWEKYAPAWAQSGASRLSAIFTSASEAVAEYADAIIVIGKSVAEKARAAFDSSRNIVERQITQGVMRIDKATGGNVRIDRTGVNIGKGQLVVSTQGLIVAGKSGVVVTPDILNIGGRDGLIVTNRSLTIGGRDGIQLAPDLLSFGGRDGIIMTGNKMVVGGPTGIAIGPQIISVAGPRGVVLTNSSASIAGHVVIGSAAESVPSIPWGIKPAPGTRIIPEGIPEGWRIRGTRGDGGVQYYNPRNPNENVRVMQSDSLSPYPNSQVPYARQQNAAGTYLRQDGSPSPLRRGGRYDPDAHIPLDQFKVR